MSDFGFALELMGVGMITVFIILLLVVVVGNLIIRLVNRFIPEEVTTTISNAASMATELNKKKIAAIVSAVNTVTKGKGRVTKIEKL